MTTIRSVVICGVLACTLVGGVGAASLRLYLVDSDSMTPTLVPGDIVACVKHTKPARGDLVVFDAPGSAQAGIKRVVAVLNDRVEYVSKELNVQGHVAPKQLIATLSEHDASDLLLEQSLFGRRFQIHETYGSSLTQVVATRTDGYFLVGDNRDHSVDSRSFGAVPPEHIKCKAVAIVATESNDALSLRRTGMIR